MKTTSHYSQVPQTEHPMDPFPQPQTIPIGWDLSDMLTSDETVCELPAELKPSEETESKKWDTR